MNLSEIKTAVDNGFTVFWKNDGYEVIKDHYGQYLIKYRRDNGCIGLTNRDGTKLNGDEKDFFMTLEYRLPDIYAPYLINCDPSGLEEEEILSIDAFIKDEGIRIIEVKDDSNFYYSNDMNNIGNNCSTFIAVKVGD
jgi:hypothetical protein